MQKLSNSAYRTFLLSKLLFKDLLRRRVTLLMLFIVPALFDVVILVTTAESEDPIVFGILSDDKVEMVSRRAMSSFLVLQQ